MTGRGLSASAAVLGVAASFALFAADPAGTAACERAWVFFDLGNTVIASAPGAESRYLPGAHEYVRELRRRGHRLGLITNVPEKWGPTRAAKIRELKKLVGETWTKDAAAEPMDWSDFPDAAIVVPPRDADRKPGPFTFRAALAEVEASEGKRDCPVVYQGEDPAEVAVAEKHGMIGYVVGKDPAAPYLPLERIAERTARR